MRRGGGGDDDVGLQQRLGQLVERQLVPAVAAGQAERPIAPAVGDEHRCRAPLSASARAVSSLVSPVPMMTTLAAGRVVAQLLAGQRRTRDARAG